MHMCQNKTLFLCSNGGFNLFQRFKGSKVPPCPYCPRASRLPDALPAVCRFRISRGLSVVLPTLTPLRTSPVRLSAPAKTLSLRCPSSRPLENGDSSPAVPSSTPLGVATYATSRSESSELVSRCPRTSSADDLSTSALMFRTSHTSPTDSSPTPGLGLRHSHASPADSSPSSTSFAIGRGTLSALGRSLERL